MVYKEKCSVKSRGAFVIFQLLAFSLDFQFSGKRGEKKLETSRGSIGACRPADEGRERTHNIIQGIGLLCSKLDPNKPVPYDIGINWFWFCIQRSYCVVKSDSNAGVHTSWGCSSDYQWVAGLPSINGSCGPQEPRVGLLSCSMESNPRPFSIGKAATSPMGLLGAVAENRDLRIKVCNHAYLYRSCKLTHSESR
ncbi:hypothetical protein VNO77_19934 [Canavalia gladiata]|uniref:Uncharacterized protein n=1 Tax=Canavalia gladiata TaxID=3824 RepID=A0AAN9LSH2_CANGL